MKKYYLLFLSIFVFNLLVQAQNVVEVIELESLTAQQITINSGFPASFGATTYKLLYNTVDIDGNETVASGFFAVPNDRDLAFPTLVYQHGTVFTRNAVPSNGSDEADIGLLAAGQGYISILPDYLGLGDNPGIHPYLHADTEASAAIDMLFAVEEFLENEGVPKNEQLFITGYSQGGHAAAALQKALQEDFADVFTVTASAPASGPYHMKSFNGLVEERVYLTPAFAAATVLSYNDVYNIYENLEAIFKPAYATFAEQYMDGEIQLDVFNEQLVLALTTEVGASIPREMFQDSIITLFNENNTAHPLIQAFADNDLTEWAPQAPTRLFYCVDDETVDASNSIVADSIMNELGAADVEATNLGGNLNHVQCVTPALINVVLFFGSFQELTTSVEQLTFNSPITVFPNPVKETLYLRGLSPGAVVELYGLNGQLLLSSQANDADYAIDVANQQSGFYFLRIVDKTGIFSQKIVIE